MHVTCNEIPVRKHQNVIILVAAPVYEHVETDCLCSTFLLSFSNPSQDNWLLITRSSLLLTELAAFHCYSCYTPRYPSLDLKYTKKIQLIYTGKTLNCIITHLKRIITPNRDVFFNRNESFCFISEKPMSYCCCGENFTIMQAINKIREMKCSGGCKLKNVQLIDLLLQLL